MKTLKFKSNINCGKCIASVTPNLNATVGVGNWEVDTTNPEKILTVKTEEATAESVEKAVTSAGFKATFINN